MRKTLLLSLLLLLALCPAAAQKYWVTATTVPDWSSLSETREFSLDVAIDGTTATISGWQNLGLATGATPKDTAGTVTGTYDAATHVITIQTPQYQYNDTVGNYTDLYYATGSWGTEYRYVLLSCTYADDYNITDHDSLTLKVSDDMSTITAEENVVVGNLYWYDWGGYWFRSSSDYYQSFVMNRMPEEATLVSSDSLIDLSSVYLAPGKTTSASFAITNRGQNATEYTVTTTDPQLSIDSLATGTISGGEKITIPFSLTPTEPNPAFSQTINVNYGGKTVAIAVNAVVSELQDYSKIVSEGDFSFYNDDDNSPYTIDTTTYGKTVAKASTEDGATSTFNVKFTVPEGKIATLAWSGEAKDVNARINFRSNIYVSGGEGYRWILNKNPQTADGTVSFGDSALFLAGDYDYKFYTYVDEAGTDPHVYVDNLSLKLADLQDNEAQLLNDSLDFGTSYAGGDTVSLQSTVTLRNKGAEPLQVDSISSDNPEFGGIITGDRAETLADLATTLTFKATTAGEHTANVTLHTSAGDFTVKAKATLETLAIDYSPIVESGDFLFNTSYEHPFLVDTTNAVAYNSTTGEAASGNEESWIEASFYVPDGATATLSWTGHNSSAAMNYSWWTGGYSLADGTRITIDGTKTKEIGGDNDASSAVFDAADLKFAPGHHVVRFLYQKQNATPTGDDKLTLSKLNLDVEVAAADSAVIDAAGINFSNSSVLGKSWATVNIRNLGRNELRLNSVTASDDSVFTALIPDEGAATLDTLKVDVCMAPTTTGSHSGTVVLHTTAGDFTLQCDGEATALQDTDGNTIDDNKLVSVFQEDFEHGLSRWENVADSLGNIFHPNTDDVFYSFEGGGYMHFPFHDNGTALGANVRGGALVTPEFEVPDEGKTYLSYYSFASQSDALVLYDSDPEETIDEYDILYADSCDRSYIFRPQRGTRWYHRLVDMSQLAGQTIRLAWQPQGGEFYVFDDVLVYNVKPAVADGISSVNANAGSASGEVVEIYSANGVRTDRLTRGLNIVRYADGTVKKIMKK